MRLKLRVALLMLVAAAAAFTGAEAWRSLRRADESLLPSEIYERFSVHADAASYFLRDREGYVAVYEGRRAREPVDVTGIETAGLRTADRAMIEAGIPVLSRQELLVLLEDLGS